MPQINPEIKNKQATNETQVVYNLLFDSRQQFYKFLGTVMSFISSELFEEIKEEKFTCRFDIPTFHEEDFLTCVLEFHEQHNYMFKYLGYLKTDDGRKFYLQSFHRVNPPVEHEVEEEVADEFFTINERKNDDDYDMWKENQ